MVIEKKLLTPNQYSRPTTKRSQTTKIAVHYVGNPNTSAIANRNYFEGLKDTHSAYVSAHYVVGLEGEVIQCIPDDEIGYTTNQANAYSIGIETCHSKSDGVFNDKTYISLCELCAVLLKKYDLTVNDLIRHYDVTKKQCPLDWSPTKYQSEVIATAKWNRFKQDVQTVLNGGKVTRNNTVGITEKNIVTNVQSVTPANTALGTPYLIKVIDTSLNVRKNAGINYPVSCVIKKNEIYTIVEENQIVNSDGSKAIWGKLKSGAGWINVGEKYVKKV